MNESELAALIGSTIHFSAVKAPNHATPCPQSRIPTLSPRQQFESQVRRLGHSRQSQSAADVDLRPQTGSVAHRSHDGRTPRVQHHRVGSAFALIDTPQLISQADHNGKKIRRSMSAQIVNPDFVMEERAAWSRQSPRIIPDLTLVHHNAHAHQARSNGSLRQRSAVLKPPRQSNAPPPQVRRHPEQTIPLQEFGPPRTTKDMDDRPKTSRGLRPGEIQDKSENRKEGNDPEADQDSAASAANRRSKFLEGSLNEKSLAVASSWYDQGSTSEDSYDSDATPQASRDTRGSCFFESNESMVLPVTPTTTKKKLFRLKSNVASSEDSGQAKEQPPAKKKGLRKSLSMWNFHNLGDKMKIFGSSSNDLTPKAAKINKVKAVPLNPPAEEILDDRKRKAEEAYAQQFGLKRQKSNNGMATSNASQISVNKPSSLKQRSASGSSYTITWGQRRRVPSSNTLNSYGSDQSSSDFDNRRRPSMTDLERENRYLRAMLRKSTSMHLEREAKRSSPHLPLDERCNRETRLCQEDFAQGNKVKLSPGRRMGRRGEDVPPVPKVPREVLIGLENGWVGRQRVGSQKAQLPKAVPMMMEVDEINGEALQDVENLAKRPGRDMTPIKEQWEWPDDVF